MKIIVKLWDQNGMDSLKVVEYGNAPMEIWKWAVQRYAEKYNHPPSDGRIKVR